MRRLVAATLVAAGAAVLPQSFAWAQMRPIEISHVSAPVGPDGETPGENPVGDFGSDEILHGRPALMLAVNGRIVATDGEPAVATTEGWNWTLLLLGCVGLVLANLSRRPVRRAVLSPY
jgi:hypothetical protein